MVLPVPDLNLIEYRPGLRAYTSPRGIRVIEVDWWADPAHDTLWAERARVTVPDKDWRREMGRDWSTPAGDAFFPAFSEIGRARCVMPATRLISGYVYRAFDFGRRRPACIWFQYSLKSDRAWLLREFMPHDLQTHDFRDAVRFLSNQLPWEQVPERAQRWVEAYTMRPSGIHCPPPWFPLGVRFLDISGPEANQVQANATSPEESTAADIFAAAGLNLIVVTPKVKGRNRVVDRMISVRPDGHPGLIIDPQCEESIIGFEGAFAYPKPTKQVPVPTKPFKDGHFENLLDAIGYGFVAVVPADAPTASEQRQGRGIEEAVDWLETRPQAR